jgi:hypothetical protein
VQESSLVFPEVYYAAYFFQVSQVYCYRQGLCQISVNAQKTQITRKPNPKEKKDIQQIRLDGAKQNISPKLFHVEQSAQSAVHLQFHTKIQPNWPRPTPPLK